MLGRKGALWLLRGGIWNTEGPLQLGLPVLCGLCLWCLQNKWMESTGKFLSWLSEAGQETVHCIQITWEHAKMFSLVDYYVLLNIILCLSNVDNITVSSHKQGGDCALGRVKDTLLREFFTLKVSVALQQQFISLPWVLVVTLWTEGHENDSVSAQLYSLMRNKV